jgi:hypothetical protein
MINVYSPGIFSILGGEYVQLKSQLYKYKDHREEGNDLWLPLERYDELDMDDKFSLF